ncbi:pre-mRNA-splicing factor 38B-like isoform X2 [Culicoides brevitarsis]|uniref:pre-mRNA-splicing factor 38B-like isoform X2 n=1 Tax=Culicoides brevitarsis TaxID=469753 RepID=UPI00307C2D43
MDYGNYEDGEIVEQQQQRKTGKQNNVLPFWGNESTMNLNPLILTNIQGSSYFKVNLFKLKTYHEVVDEIYYQVKHLEPWERGSRKTGQTGMCGGVRGVGAGGIVSSAYCLLYKLYTLKLTRKQVNGLMNHTDSPYIRGLGFMYIRYTQPPGDLFDWYADYLQDDEEIDVKAGGGQLMTIGQMLRLFMTKLDWFSTLFPRIPVPIQKQIEQRMNEYARENGLNFNTDGPSNRGAPREEIDRYAENGRERGRNNYQAQSNERYGSSSGSYKSRDEPRDDRRERRDRYDDRRDRDRDRYREERRRREYDDERPVRYESEERKKRSHSPDERRHRDKYEKDERSSYRDAEEKHSRHRSKEKKKHKKKHKHHSRSRSRSHERSEKKYR